MSCVCPHVCGLLTPGYDDCEGDLLASIRELVGPNVLISSELDPHSHLTQKRFDAADILIAFKEFSHGTLLAGASATLPSVIRHCAFARSALYPANFRASCMQWISWSARRRWWNSRCVPFEAKSSL